jgi:alkanesulfonate monooxygenase SsuD/methylene tetrahydromethanopterin reductase-like flavin-dependent oxidoreductase (luciferase family)
MKLEGLGIWTAQFDFQPASEIRRVARELEEWGYGSLWIGENIGRDAISQAGLLLASTERLIVATGVANIWARDPRHAGGPVDPRRGVSGQVHPRTRG